LLVPCRNGSYVSRRFSMRSAACLSQQLFLRLSIKFSSETRAALPKGLWRHDRIGLQVTAAILPDRLIGWRRSGVSNPDARLGLAVFGTVSARPKTRITPPHWSAGPDSNRVRRGLQSRASTTSASGANCWQGTRDSNSAIPGLESGALPIEPVPRGAPGSGAHSGGT
jgi:hypothetical protein